MDSSWRSVAKILPFNLSRNKTLRTLETTAESIANAGYTASEFLDTVLSSVASPGILDVVIIYRDWDFGGWVGCFRCKPDPVCFRHATGPALKYFSMQVGVLCKMHIARKSLRFVFCVDVYGCVEDFGVQVLTSAVKKAVANGQFEYLAHRPVITCEGRSVRTRPRDYRAGVSASAL